MGKLFKSELDELGQHDFNRLCSYFGRTQDEYHVLLIQGERFRRYSLLEEIMVLEALERMHQIDDFFVLKKLVLIQDIAKTIRSLNGKKLSSSKVSGILVRLGLYERKRKAGSGLTQLVLRKNVYSKLLKHYKIKKTVWKLSL